MLQTRHIRTRISGLSLGPLLLLFQRRPGKLSEIDTRECGCSPRSSRVHYSDRFIPCRSTSARVNFSLAEKEGGPWEGSKAAGREDGTQAYNMLLRSELLGMPSALGSPERGQNGSTSPLVRCLSSLSDLA